MSVTIKDIAKHIGKSVTTVSRALNNFDDVSAETKDLVQRTANEMGYVPNTLAQRLQKQSADTIGLVIPTFGPRFSDPFFSELLAGIGNKAAELGYDLLVSTRPPDDREMLAYHQLVEGRRVDGFIVVRTRRQDARVDYLRRIKFPFVAFGRVEGELDFPYVDEDGDRGMRLVAEHLVKRGHSRIAGIVPNLDLMFAYYRLEGLRAGLAQHGIELKEEYIRSGNLTQRDGFEQAISLLSLLEPPTAIAAGNDLMALGAMSAAQERGLVVGKDIAITGFDDIPLAEHAQPPLTTVNQPIYLIGNMICEMLIGIISGKKLEHSQILLEPSLVIRQSCGSG